MDPAVKPRDDGFEQLVPAPEVSGERIAYPPRLERGETERHAGETESWKLE